jgi:hypothetical protein
MTRTRPINWGNAGSFRVNTPMSHIRLKPRFRLSGVAG